MKPSMFRYRLAKQEEAKQKVLARIAEMPRVLGVNVTPDEIILELDNGTYPARKRTGSWSTDDQDAIISAAKSVGRKIVYTTYGDYDPDGWWQTIDEMHPPSFMTVDGKGHINGD